MIITVIPIATEQGARAEFLLSWLMQLNNREKRGHALLVFDGVHPEFIDRIKLSAELVFESFDMLIPASKDTKEKMASAVVRRNNMYLSAFEYAQKTFRCPFLVLEPESTPTNPQWMENIEKAWEQQPRRYMLCHLQDAKDAPRFPLSVGVYHMGCHNDVSAVCAATPETPWERSAGELLVSKSTKSRAFQFLKVQDESDFSKAWPEAQIISSDPSGQYVEKLRAEGVHLTRKHVAEVVAAIQSPPIYTMPQPIVVGVDPRNGDLLANAPKPDLRTKEGRAWKAANVNGNGAH